MGQWPYTKFIIVKEWMDRLWDSPLQCPIGIGLPIHYLMALRMELRALRGESSSLDDCRIPFRSNTSTDEVDLLEETRKYASEAVGIPDTEPSPQRDKVLVIQSVGARFSGGIVRITQPDGSLRRFDVNQGIYLE